MTRKYFGTDGIRGTVGQYPITPDFVLRLAHAAWATSSLAPIARPYLDELSAETGETIHLAQMDGGQVLYVDKRNATKPVEMFAQAGKVGPAYCTGVGKAMLAFMPPEAVAAAVETFPTADPEGWDFYTSRDAEDTNPTVGYVRVDHARYQWIIDMRAWIKANRKS